MELHDIKKIDGGEFKKMKIIARFRYRNEDRVNKFWKKQEERRCDPYGVEGMGF